MQHRDPPLSERDDPEHPDPRDEDAEATSPNPPKRTAARRRKPIAIEPRVRQYDDAVSEFEDDDRWDAL